MPLITQGQYLLLANQSCIGSNSLLALAKISGVACARHFAQQDHLTSWLREDTHQLYIGMLIASIFMPKWDSATSLRLQVEFYNTLHVHGDARLHHAEVRPGRRVRVHAQG